MQIFTPSMPDPFHPDITDESLDQFMATGALNPHITYQSLTKRTEQMFEYFNRAECKDCVEYAARWILPGWESRQDDFEIEQWPLPNLHLGVSVENQAAADERIPWLLKTPAAKRFLRVEPLLEPIDLWGAKYDLAPGNFIGAVTAWKGGVDQVIVGGESGPGARPFHLEWARSLHQQCQAAGTAFFLKQVGSNPFLAGEPLKLKDRKGGDLMELPEELRIREII
jgi:protein gp37